MLAALKLSTEKLMVLTKLVKVAVSEVIFEEKNICTKRDIGHFEQLEKNDQQPYF